MVVSKYQLKSSCAAVRDCDKVIQPPVGAAIWRNALNGLMSGNRQRPCIPCVPEVDGDNSVHCDRCFFAAVYSPSLRGQKWLS